MKRDTYRSKLYYTEDRLLTEFNEYVKRFNTLVEIDEFFLKPILTSSWWNKRYPNIKTVFLHEGPRSGKYAWAEKNALYLPPEFRNQLCILHELAHAICCHIYESYNTTNEKYAVHGLEFIQVYGLLIKKFLGKTVYDRFISILKEYKVIKEGV